MLRIGEQGSNDPGKLLTNPVSGPARQGAPAVNFAQQFESSRATADQQDLEALISQVDKQAQMLLRAPTPAMVASFRDAIRRYLKQVNAKIGKVDKRTDRRNRTLIILRQLDDKLAELTDSILKGQTKAIDLAASINEIRGMLLDLLI